MKLHTVKEIGENFFIIRSQEKDFHRNIYLKSFKKDGKSINMIMDPGTRLDFEPLVEILTDLIGGIENINIIFVTHQDPDVTFNVRAFLTASPKSFVMASVDTLRFIKMLDIPDVRQQAIENFKSDELTIKPTGHRFKIIQIPYCHARGAIAMYDLETKIIFSGDLFGGLNTKKTSKDTVYANEESWEGISIFHQIYMPSKHALQVALDKISSLEPMPKMIAPQHGDVIKGELVGDFIQKLYNLSVGIEIMTKKDTEIELLITVLNKFIDKLKQTNNIDAKKFLDTIKNEKNFTTAISIIKDSVIDVKVSSKEAIYIFFEAIDTIAEEKDKNIYTAILVNLLDYYNLPIPEQLLKDKFILPETDVLE